jgi:hypothetical protein
MQFWGVHWIGANTFDYRLDGGANGWERMRNNFTQIGAEYVWSVYHSWKNNVQFWDIIAPTEILTSSLWTNFHFWYFDQIDVQYGVANFLPCRPKYENPISPMSLYGTCPDGTIEDADDNCSGGGNKVSNPYFASNDKQTPQKPKAFPLPATDFITITDVPIGEELLFYNAYGGLVLHQLVKETTTEINMKELPVGVYFVGVPGNEFIRVIKQ